MDAFNQILRRRLREQAVRPPNKRTDGTLYHDGTAVGTVGGLKYTKMYRGGYTLTIAGQTADQPDGEYLMALWPDELPAAEIGDTLAIGDKHYRVLAVQDRGAYTTYRLELIP